MVCHNILLLSRSNLKFVWIQIFEPYHIYVFLMFKSWYFRSFSIALIFTISPLTTNRDSSRGICFSIWQLKWVLYVINLKPLFFIQCAWSTTTSIFLYPGWVKDPAIYLNLFYYWKKIPVLTHHLDVDLTLQL